MAPGKFSSVTESKAILTENYKTVSCEAHGGWPATPSTPWITPDIIIRYTLVPHSRNGHKNGSPTFHISKHTLK